MAATEHPLQALAAYLPDGSFDKVVAYINHYKVHLTVTRSRKSVLGNYRHSGMHRNHQITVNGDLNKYEFLITLLHEIGHLLTFEAFGNRVEPHGKEWKAYYSQLLTAFMGQQFFPPDVEQALRKSVRNPAATANGETELLAVLRKYNTNARPQFSLLSQLADGSYFKTEEGRLFRKLSLRRKRYACMEVATGRLFSFSPIAEVQSVAYEG